MKKAISIKRIWIILEFNNSNVKGTHTSECLYCAYSENTFLKLAPTAFHFFRQHLYYLWILAFYSLQEAYHRPLVMLYFSPSLLCNVKAIISCIAEY